MHLARRSTSYLPYYENMFIWHVEEKAGEDGELAESESWMECKMQESSQMFWGTWSQYRSLSHVYVEGIWVWNDWACPGHPPLTLQRYLAYILQYFAFSFLNSDFTSYVWAISWKNTCQGSTRWSMSSMLQWKIDILQHNRVVLSFSSPGIWMTRREVIEIGGPWDDELMCLGGLLMHILPFWLLSLHLILLLETV